MKRSGNATAIYLSSPSLPPGLFRIGPYFQAKREEKMQCNSKIHHKPTRTTVHNQNTDPYETEREQSFIRNWSNCSKWVFRALTTPINLQEQRRSFACRSGWSLNKCTSNLEVVQVQCTVFTVNFHGPVKASAWVLSREATAQSYQPISPLSPVDVFKLWFLATSNQVERCQKATSHCHLKTWHEGKPQMPSPEMQPCYDSHPRRPDHLCCTETCVSYSVFCFTTADATKIRKNCLYVS